MTPNYQKPRRRRGFRSRGPKVLCRGCGGPGWRLQPLDGDRNELMIERCDDCKKFASDHDATVHVATLALRLEVKV